MKGQSGNWITRPFFFKRFKQQNGVGNLLVRKQDPVDGEVAWRGKGLAANPEDLKTASLETIWWKERTDSANCPPTRK